MEIFINNSKIDFQLENEKLLHQVITGIDEWAVQDDFHIQEIIFDDKAYYRDDKDCTECSVEDISVLKITAKNRIEIHQENLQLLYQYISLFLKSIEGRNATLIDELKKEAESVTRLLSEFLEESIDAPDSISNSLKLNIRKFNIDDSGKHSELTTSLIHQLNSLKIILKERISELSDPLGELVKTTKALKQTQNEINDISVLLQTGKDREALTSIIKFSELSQKIVRLYPFLKNSGIVDFEEIIINGIKLPEYYNDLNGILSELLEAFTAHDSVLIGDLLEYEVAPRLESLIEVFEKIQEDSLQ